MQGVPVGIEIEEIREEIKAIPGVISVHDLHIWQLTNVKMVSSLHILVANQEVFERVSRAVKTIMHRAGVHSTTIQPEFPGMQPTRLSGEDGQPLLSRGEKSSHARSLGAQSNESLSTGSGNPTSPSNPGTGRAEADTTDGTLTTGALTVVNESNCALLCADGEQACDVGSCCTAPVKR